MDRIIYYYFNFTLLSAHIPEILQGFLVTIEMAVLTVVLGILLGLALAVLRAYQWRSVNILIMLFADIFRALPQLVLIVLAAFALPYVGLILSPFVATVGALSLVLAAFAEEIFWGAFASIPIGQWEAPRSTGLTFTQTLFGVILPQAVKIALPSLTNRAIAISKATTLGSVIAVPELLGVATSVESTLANPSALTLSALLFLALFFPFVRFTRWLERRYGGWSH